MDFDFTPRAKEYIERVQAFMDAHVYPNEETYDRQMVELGNHTMDHTQWKIPPILEELKEKAKAQGLWNLFLPEGPDVPGLKNAEYAPCSEIMGRIEWASEVFNCSAPDTGNMEVLARYGSEAQKEEWLKPLLAGKIRSAFLMTEPDVASSDATNIQTRIERDGDHYVINGRKWWSSGLGDPRCKIAILMGKTDPGAPTHQQQSQILLPLDTPGIKIVRMLNVFGYNDAPHGHAEIILDNVRVPKENIILGEGRGFEIAQGRLGPGRIHHCMRTIGMTERALEKLCQRILTREAFGKPVAEHSVWEQRIAEARIEIEQARLLTLKAAHMMDTVGNKGAKNEIAMIKVAAPRMACRIIDMAIQAHGGGGISQAFGTAKMYAMQRTLRLADGPDEVHCRAIARAELKKHKAILEQRAAQ